jgi:hypothetical protein
LPLCRHFQSSQPTALFAHENCRARSLECKSCTCRRSSSGRVFFLTPFLLLCRRFRSSQRSVLFAHKNCRATSLRRESPPCRRSSSTRVPSQTRFYRFVSALGALLHLHRVSPNPLHPPVTAGPSSVPLPGQNNAKPGELKLTSYGAHRHSFVAVLLFTDSAGPLQHTSRVSVDAPDWLLCETQLGFHVC